MSNTPSELLRLVPAESPVWLDAMPRTSLLKHRPGLKSSLSDIANGNKHNQLQYLENSICFCAESKVNTEEKTICQTEEESLEQCHYLQQQLVDDSVT